MMMLKDVKDYIKTLQIAEYVYMGKMPDKQDKAIGVYHSKHEHEYQTALGGEDLRSYGVKYVTLLIHWNKSPGETEAAALRVQEALRRTREASVNQEKIKFIHTLYDIQDVGTDEAGIYEMVIEAAVVYEKGKGD